jgi:ABC transporter ATM
LKNGAVAEQGTHDDLISRQGGIYEELWNAQEMAFVEGEQEGEGDAVAKVLDVDGKVAEGEGISKSRPPSPTEKK